MAKEPGKKKDKKKESAQTHVKRQQASKRRIRNKGKFSNGPKHSHLNAIFHGAISRQTHNPLKRNYVRTMGGDLQDIDQEEGTPILPTGGEESRMVHTMGQEMESGVQSSKRPPAATGSGVKWSDRTGKWVPTSRRREHVERAQELNQRADARRAADETDKAADHFVPSEDFKSKEYKKFVADEKLEAEREANKERERKEQARARRAQDKQDNTYSFERRQHVRAFPHSSDPTNFVEAADEERRRGGSGRASGAQEDTDTFAESKYDGGEYIPRMEKRPDGTWQREPHNKFQARVYQQYYDDFVSNGAYNQGDAKTKAAAIAFNLTNASYGTASTPESIRLDLEPRTIRSERDPEVMGRGKGEPHADRSGNYPPGRVWKDDEWQDQRGLVYGMPKPKEDEPLIMARGKKRPPTEQIMDRLPDEYKLFAAQQGFQGKDRADFAALAYDNFSVSEIMMWMQEGKPEQLATHKAAQSTLRDKKMDMMAAQDQYSRKYGDKGSVRDKYDAGQGSHASFAYSMQAAGVDSMENLRKRFPNASEYDLISYQEAQRTRAEDYMLEANERWAHETRQARVAGKGGKANIEQNDRVVVFTTNAGAPTVAVPANSLVGQYVIKKRKRMVVDDKLASRTQVKGEFPRAVRDQHLIEVSTGVSLGIQGRVGLFHNTGWKVKNKRSKGYGKKAPLGAQVLRDSTGQPIYDKDGNVRYTEGYTRPFAAGTDRDVGLRIFIG